MIDRLFWVYFIIVLVFIIIGISALLSLNFYVLAALWVLLNILLLLAVYFLLRSCLTNCEYGVVWCLFIAGLLLNLGWAIELGSAQSNTQIRDGLGILALGFGLVLTALACKQEGNYLPYNWELVSPASAAGVAYCALWVIILFRTII